MKHYKSSIKYWLMRNHYLLILAVVVTATGLFGFFFRQQSDWQILVTIVGGAVSLIYIIEKQQLEEARLFKELFTEFNSRYDKLNGELERIKTTKGPLSSDDNIILFDYFNLCGEEYLFYRNGYVYPEVWKSWYAGMAKIAETDKIEKLWTEELKSDSYYGFSLPVSDSKLKKEPRSTSGEQAGGLAEGTVENAN